MRWHDPILVSAFLLSITLLAECAKFLVTVPKRPHYDSVLVVTVTAVGIVDPQKITLTYKGEKDTSRVLRKKDILFKSDGMQNWGVTFPWEEMQKFQEKGVKLIVGNDFTFKEESLKFHHDTGYIFIQTDKPVYTPRQTVRFRIMAVDDDQKLAKYQLKVDIKNPEGVILARMRYTSEEAFRAQSFELPREATEGQWSITANYEGLDNSYATSKTVEFEVKEYVLPRFSAKLRIDTDVVTRDTEWISMFVTAKYVYGRPVQGLAEIQLGIWDEYEGVTILPAARFTKPLLEGNMRQDIRIPRIFPLEQEFPKNKRLYVQLNVVEAGTGENDTIIDTSTYISHPYYVVSFDHSDLFFKPGFPYTLKVDASSKSGVPTPWTQLYVNTSFKNQQGTEILRKDTYQKVDETARLVVNYDAVPVDTHKMETSVYVLDFSRSTYNIFDHQVEKLESKTNNYIHISVVSLFKRNRAARVELKYTRNENTDQSQRSKSKITVQVLTRGHVVYTKNLMRNSDGRTILRLPKNLKMQVSPSMRILAYYYADNGSEKEFVSDSLLVDTDDICLEEVGLRKPGGMFGSSVPYKPKARYNMEVLGSPGMTVGFVAVDEAVFLVNDAQTLTRKLLFEQLGSHDQGKGEGDGRTFEDILSNSGLKHILFDPDDGGSAFYDSMLVSYELDLMPEIKEPGMRRTHNVQAVLIGPVREKLASPQTVRRYFPESWLFEEKVLSSSMMVMNVTLPDTITTWNFLAVGLSAKRGICVSRPLRQQVMKLFFADIRMPYKVTRLEEVKVKLAIYNYQSYPLEISGKVRGSDGLCFSANAARGGTQNDYTFKVNIPAKGIHTEVVKVIPLKNGDLTLQADLQSQSERDVVERKLYVVAEGLRVRKSITFVLDPEAKHMSYQKAQNQKILLENSATINNIFDMKKKEQNTTIDLALPEEVIRGTEFCRISAFGDLMGDIITHAVVQSKSLVDQPVTDAEEVLGDLGPTVHALLYVTKAGLSDQTVTEKGQRFIAYSVTRLLKYHKKDHFRLTTKSKPATWLTAVLLKTLCHSSKLTFIDRKPLIDDGFEWLLQQANYDATGSLREQDRRLAQSSFDYDVMLSAEALIAVFECDRTNTEGDLHLMGDMAIFLEDHLDNVTEPMVLAKAAYALMLFDEESEAMTLAADRLWSLHKRTELGHIYWSDRDLNLDRFRPFWYQLGAKASSIEATAYALLVFLETRGRADVDAIADWLVGQRNANGAFVGALDSMAAIQALSMYSLQKHGEEIDLSCNVSSNQHTREYSHSFKFTLKNATSPEDLHNVPLGQKLEVLTRGQGLGQMHVNVEYNIPVDKNAHCHYNVSVQVKSTQFRWTADFESNPLCAICNVGCDGSDDDDEAELDEEDADVMVGASRQDTYSTSIVGTSTKSRHNQPRINSPFSSRHRPSSRRHSRGPAASRNPGRDARRSRRRHSRRRSHRTRRSVRNVLHTNKRSVCIQVCLKHLDSKASGPVSVDLEMLTGYQPDETDVKRLEEQTGVHHAEYDQAREVLVVQFEQIPNNRRKCFTIRAYDQEEVGKALPATLVIKEFGQPQPSCFMEYKPPSGEESLQVFCAHGSNKNRGECRCFSGICSRCYPEVFSDGMDYNEVEQLTCKSDVAYQVKMNSLTGPNQWVEIDATVLALNRTGTHELSEGDKIKLITPSSCFCPHQRYGPGREIPEGDRMFLLSPDVEKLVDHKGNYVYRYLLDENSAFLQVGDDGRNTTPAVPFAFMQRALRYTCKR